MTLPPVAQPFPDSEKYLIRQRIRSTVRLLRRSVWMILTVTIAAIAVTAVINTTLIPAYESDSTLFVAAEGGPSLDLIAGLGALNGIPSGITGIGETTLGRHIALLSSRSAVEEVVRAGGLQVGLMDSKLARSAVFQSVVATDDAPAGLYVLRLSSDGSYQLEGSPEALRFRIGEPGSLPGVRFLLNPSLATDPPATISIRVSAFWPTVNGVRGSLTVSQPQRESPVIRVHFRSSDPELAAMVPNLLTEQFIQEQRNTALSSTGEYASFLTSQVAQYENELSEVESDLEAFMRSTEFVNPEVQSEAAVANLVQLEVSRDSLGRHLESIQAYLRQADSVAPERLGPRDYQQLAANPFFAADPAVDGIIAAILRLEEERTALLVRRTPTSSEVQSLEFRIREMELRLRALARENLRSLETQIAAYDQGLARMQRELQAIPANQIALARLLRQQQLLEQIYILVETKLKEQEMQEARVGGTDARILDAALVPTVPVSPAPMVNLLIAMIVGLCLGGGLAVGRSYMDSAVRTKRDIQDILPGVSFLGTIPRFPKPGENGARTGLRNFAASLRNGLSNSLRSSTKDQGNEAVSIILSSDDAVSEAYRTLGTNLTRAAAFNSHRTLVITSAGMGEGKSFSAAYLALALAHRGTRTLLIDADLRRSSLHELLNLERTPGLSELVEGSATVLEATQTIATSHFGIPLDVITAGESPDRPTELLESVAMRDLLDGIRGAYDIVVLDSPPLNAVSDAAFLAAYADAAVLVVRAGVTQEPEVWSAAVRLQQLSTSLVGVVMTGAEPKDIATGLYE